MFGFLFKKKGWNNIGHQLFQTVIDQTRIPIFYSELAVEDSIDGRFDLMALNMAFVLDKLDMHNDVEGVSTLKRILQEIMFDNLDLTLREIGVGDLGVGKKIKVMAEAFYGRMMVYQDLFKSRDTKNMSEALKRNLYRGEEVDQAILDDMISYSFGQSDHTRKQSLEKVVSGEINFLAPREFIHA